MSVNELMERFKNASALRVQGLSAVAIEEFTELLRETMPSETKARSKFYAERGASKLALAFQSVQDLKDDEYMVENVGDDETVSRGAIEDFTVAVTLDPGNGWAWAQLGEAHRTFARDHFRVMPQSRFKSHTEGALNAFAKAEEVFQKTEGLLSRYEAWLLAHKAATYFLIVWHKWDIDNFTTEDPFQVVPPAREITEAQECFEAAITNKPDYAWAMRFHAFLLTCQGQYEAAQKQLKKAADIDRRTIRNESTDSDEAFFYPHVKRSLAMLYRYRAERLKNDPEQRRRALEEALLQSKNVMAHDSDDFYATYAYAAATAELETADAKAICREARDGILNQVMRGILMAFALHKKANDPKDFIALLFETIMNAGRDLELLTLATHDPAWGKGDHDLLEQFQAALNHYSKVR